MTASKAWAAWMAPVCLVVLSGACALALASDTASAPAGAQGLLGAADVVVAADGSGNFKTIAQALASLDPAGKGRVVILIRDGVYNEHLAVRRSCVTLRGQSRKGTRVEYSLAYGDWDKHQDDIGRGVVNVYGDAGATEAVVTWGSPTGALREIGELAGVRVVQPVVLWPPPVRQLRDALSGAHRVAVAEVNATGQLANLLERHGLRVDTRINRYDGRPWGVGELHRRIQEVLA